MAAAAAALVAVAVVFWSLFHWSGSRGREVLALLPDPQTFFVFEPSWIASLPPIVLLVVTASGFALMLMALATILEGVDTSRREQTDPPPRRQSRLATSGRLRIAAAMVALCWVAVPVVPGFWWRLALKNAQGIHDTYYVGGTAQLIVPTAIGGAIALLMLALAAILDRLDANRQQTGVGGK